MKSEKPQIYLKRKFDSFLGEWKAREDRLPLIIKGARQVGKTECVRHFASGNYESFLELNFVERPEFKVIIRDGYSVKNIISNISAVDPTFKFIPGKTLIFFDEIQEFPEICTSFKFFAQQGDYDVIASGSLLGVHYKRIESISVGYQETETMRSMDFEEFLWARGYTSEQIESFLEPISQGKPFSDALTQTMDRLFMDYCALGGMPDVLESYFVRGSFEGVPRIQKRILADYRADIRKYCEGLDPERIIAVFDSIPAQLAKENKKFQWSAVSKGASNKDYWGCVEWLMDAGVVNKCKRLDFPELPIAGHVQNDFYKLYLSDSGLLMAQLDEESQNDVRVRRNLGTWKGGLFENVVAEALVKAGYPLAYYKKENSTLELDFFVRAENNLVPIEVKASNNQAKSLKTVIVSPNYKDIQWGVKFINGNIGFENNILTLPHWSVFLLRRILKVFKTCDKR